VIIVVFQTTAGDDHPGSVLTGIPNWRAGDSGLNCQFSADVLPNAKLVAARVR
jgi:hypothetical protein